MHTKYDIQWQLLPVLTNSLGIGRVVTASSAAMLLMQTVSPRLVAHSFVILLLFISINFQIELVQMGAILRVLTTCASSHDTPAV